MPRYSRRNFLFLVALLPGCVTLHRAEHSAPSPVKTGRPPQALVIVVDGAGGFKGASRTIEQTVNQEGLPIQVETYPWSHGYLRVVADHMDEAHALEAGRRLSGEIMAHKGSHPDLPIFLAAHSAGSMVLLEATRTLPPECIERIILLSPAVSDIYDLRPALTAVRDSVDVYYSHLDWGFLGIATRFLGTTDRNLRPAAGRVGFQINANCPADAQLYSKLRQHPWHACVAWSGNPGGHYGAYQPGFLRAYVFPLIFNPDSGTPPPADSPVIKRAERLRVK